MKPFLRWAGGKQRSASRLTGLAPSSETYSRFVEPFLGGGSIFLRLRPNCAMLSDKNRDIVEAFRWIQAEPIAIAQEIAKLTRHIDQDSYLAIRDEFNLLGASLERTSRFIFLNRTCYNGVWRVNRSGKFNVPFGFLKDPWFPDLDYCLGLSDILNGIKIYCASFEISLAECCSEDFVFLDPPYLPINRTSFFQHYTKDRFDACQYEILAELCLELNNKGAKFMMTTGDCKQTRALFAMFEIVPVTVRRWVSASGTATAAELVVKNY